MEHSTILDFLLNLLPTHKKTKLPIKLKLNFNSNNGVQKLWKWLENRKKKVEKLFALKPTFSVYGLVLAEKGRITE